MLLPPFLFVVLSQNILEAWSEGQPPIFVYQAWQAVHEPMDAPASYIAPYAAIEDHSRRIYVRVRPC